MEYTFSSSEHEMFSRKGHTLNHKQKHSACEWMEIIGKNVKQAHVFELLKNICIEIGAPAECLVHL